MGTRGYRRFEWRPVLGALIAQNKPTRAAEPQNQIASFGDMRKGARALPPREADKPMESPATVPVLAKAKAVAPAPRLGDRPPPPPPAAAAPPRASMAKKEAAAPNLGRVAGGAGRGPMAGGLVAAQLAPAPKAERASKKDDAADLKVAASEAPAPVAAKAARRANDDLDNLMDMDGMGRIERKRPVVHHRPVEQWAPVRVFPAPTYQPDYHGARTDFRETIYWNPAVQTGQDGKAQVAFYLSDAVTSFRVLSEAIGGGSAGRDETVIKSSLPFSMAVKLPVEVSEGDRIALPLLLANERQQPVQVDLRASFGGLLKLDRPVSRAQGALQPLARDALFYPLTVVGKKGKTEVRFVADASGLRDEFVREIEVAPRGFPQHLSRAGRLADTVTHDVELAGLIEGTADANLKVYVSSVSTLVSGLDGMLSEPGGCFEQASSTNYPNVMILRYLKSQQIAAPRITGRASSLLEHGYKLLTGYETPQRGYEWFGAAPAHEALSAYGLAEFADMKQVYPEVSGAMIKRTADWLRSRRDGKGGYLRDGKALDTFGAASKPVTDAYITYSVSEAKQPGFEREIDAQEQVARDTGDAYILALAVNTLFNSGKRDAAGAAVKRLVAMQDASGGWKNASHSITRSGGHDLQVETTSLALLGLLKSGQYDDAVEKGMEWLMHQRGGWGAFGATQATVLALKAITAYASARARAQTPGAVTLLVNGKTVGTKDYQPGDREPLVFTNLTPYLAAGKNHIELRHTGKTPLPYSLGVSYRSLQPATSAEAKVDLATTLLRPQVKMGESVRMDVTVRNKTADGLPMTLARVEIPGGLRFQTWQLKELREKGLIAFYETRPRQINLYLRQMQPGQKVELPLDLIAAVPGDYTAQASTAYLYYTAEHKTWVAGTHIVIE